MAHNPMQTYIIRTALFMSGYVAVNVAAITGAFDDVQRPGAYVLALAVSAPVAGQIWALLDCMKNADEYVSGILARPFIVAAGLAIAIFTGWGFLTEYADVPHAPGWAIYPLLWAMFGLVAPFSNKLAR
ncbi:MAG: hypothetical protein AAF830_06745 [Pseudomonadota bacterium]